MKNGLMVIGFLMVALTSFTSQKSEARVWIDKCFGVGGGFIGAGSYMYCQEGPGGIPYTIYAASVGVTLDVAPVKMGKMGCDMVDESVTPAGFWFGAKHSMGYIGGYRMAAFYRSGATGGVCVFMGIEVGAVGDLSGAVMYIKPHLATNSSQIQKDLNTTKQAAEQAAATATNK